MRSRTVIDLPLINPILTACSKLQTWSDWGWENSPVWGFSRPTCGWEVYSLVISTRALYDDHYKWVWGDPSYYTVIQIEIGNCWDIQIVLELYWRLNNGCNLEGYLLNQKTPLVCYNGMLPMGLMYMYESMFVPHLDCIQKVNSPRCNDKIRYQVVWYR